MTALERFLAGSPYVSYVYGYPHKTAYRELTPAVPLQQLWAAEDRRALFLYAHVPFCEMRCGFCNLFTAAGPADDLVERYLGQLEVEARAVAAALGGHRFARAAVGGGTPSLLTPAQLERLFDVLERTLGAALGRIPLSFELSPETTTREKVQVLARRGADRVSLGVQSFVDAEVAALKRPQQARDVAAALDHLRSARFATLNLDLIYGVEGQTEASFLESLRAALRWAPEELYLYPLYERPLTWLGRHAHQRGDKRLALYRAGRDFLLGEGYRQVSMRLFRTAAEAREAPVYRCQEDGMVGLGVGARSYTSGLHYSSEFAVGPRAVRGIIDAYLARPEASFHAAHWGFRLGEPEQRRRFMLLSLLADGLDLELYRTRFRASALDDFPELARLVPVGLAREQDGRLLLTASGVERSDLVGPWLYSTEVDGLMKAWEAR